MTIIPQVQDKFIVYTFRLTHDSSYEYKYVGLTSRGVNRLQEHINEARNPAHPRYFSKKAAWIRAHYYAITFEILEVCDSVDMLNDCEVQWIHILKERGHELLNETTGGSGTRGFSPIWYDDTKAKISQSKMGHTVSEETRRKLSEATKRNPVSAEAQRKAALSRSTNGYTHSAETRKKMSESHKNRWHGEDRIISDEARARLSATRKAMGIDNSKSLHVRWHEKRSVESPLCKHC